MPKISVIMGVYNCKDFAMLRKSVDSILQQTEGDFEFLICNDGSTNQTLEKLQEISKLDERIRILSYPNNCGLHHALNACLKEAKGKYIARQDDDDESKPDRFMKLVAFLDSHPEYDFVGSNADVFDSKGVWGEYTVEEKPQKESFYWTNPFAHPTVMFRKSAMDAVGGYRESKETRRCEDYDLFMRLYANGMKGYNIQEKLYFYRIENDTAKKYRPMKYRIDESVVRFKGYRMLGLLNIKGLIYVTKPIVIGLIPQSIFKRIRKKQY